MGHNELLLLKDSFILEKETVEGGKRKGRLGPSAALPRWAQAWHQWPERTGILDMPTALPSCYTLAPPLIWTPPLLFLLLPVWMQRLAGWVGATATVCVWNKAPQKEERGSRELHMVPAKSGDGCLGLPSQAPLLAEKWWCDPSTPFSPSVPLTPPCNPFFSVLAPCSHPETALFLRESPLNEDDMLRDLGWVISHDTTFTDRDGIPLAFVV